MEHMSEEDFEKFEQSLERPLPSQSERSLADQEMAQLEML